MSIKFQQEGSAHLIAQIGPQRFLLALNAIRESLPSALCPLLDDIASLVNHSQVIQEVPEGASNSDQQPTPQLYEENFAAHSENSGGIGFLDASLQEALQVNMGPCNDSVEQILNLQYV